MWGSYRRGDEQKAYRKGYPGQHDDETETDMIRFYRGEIPSKPHGDYIDNIHQHWFGDYSHLEIHHGYIQWIFPIREEGVNFSASRLQFHELRSIRADPVIRARVIRSYEMMLDFYGMELIDRETGEVSRNVDTYKARYNHLNSSFHNYLRISRILKALGEFGFERFKIHWIELFIEEIFEHGLLRNTLSSLQNFWVPTLRHRDERVAMKNKIHAYLKQPDTDDEGDDMGDNDDMKDLPSPPALNGALRADASTAGSEDSSTEDPSDDEETSSKENEENSDDEVPTKKSQVPEEDDKKDGKKRRASNTVLPHAQLSAATSSSSPDVSLEVVATSSIAPASEVGSPPPSTPNPKAGPATISAKSSFSEKSKSPKSNIDAHNELAASEDDEDRDNVGKPKGLASSDQTSDIALSLAAIAIGTPNMAGSSSSDCDSNLSASEDLPDKKPSDERASSKKSRSSSSKKSKKEKHIEKAT